MRIIEHASDLNPFACGIFVPTMGALHEGHASLIRRARRLADEQAHAAQVVVSIFVNPTQFNDPRDLARYPRTLDVDSAICAAAGADAIFIPSVDTMYPADGSVRVPDLPRQATTPKLEDAHRPGHFAGVCQVVKRLFELVRPRAAVFGEKDWQQLQVIRAMSAGLKELVEIVPGPIVREPDGLAMSSRNRFLTPEQRPRAVGMIAALRAARTLADHRQAEAVMARVLREHGIEPEYAVIRDAETLEPVNEISSSRHYRALVTGKLGEIRLLDNAAWSANSAGNPPL